MFTIKNDNLLSIACGGIPQTKTGAKKLKKQLAGLYVTALDALEDILKNDSAKHADKIAAAKLCFEIVKAAAPAKEDPGEIRVIFDSGIKQYAE